MRRNAEIWCPLENEEVGRLPGYLWNHLDGGRSGSNHADLLAGEIVLLARPLTGVIPAALERFDSFVLGQLRGGKATCGHHAVFGGNLIASIRSDDPAVPDFIEHRGRHPRVKLDVP